MKRKTLGVAYELLLDVHETASCQWLTLQQAA